MKKTVPHGFRIFRHEPLSETFRRTVKEQLQQSLLLCAQLPENPDYATHEIRKCTKRIRAIYRLFNPVAGQMWYHQSRDLYSNLSKVLAAYRISFVNLETMRGFQQDNRTPVSSEYIAHQISMMEQSHRQLTTSLFHEQRADRYLAATIQAEIKSLAEKPLPACSFDDIAPAFRKTYSQGKKCLDKVLVHPSAEHHHELRKMTKALWNQMILLRPVYPAMMGLVINHLDILAKRLGQEHDLAELETFLNREKNEDTDLRRPLLAFIGKRRFQIQKSLKSLAVRIYADKSAGMIRKIKVYYSAFAGK